MNCQICSQNVASVHVTNVLGFDEANGNYELEQRHICDGCAQQMNLPTQPVNPKSQVDILKLLKQAAMQSRRQAEPGCPTCQMTLKEFRNRGKLGCPDCYETFAQHLDPLLQRMHNATRHVGRVPGLSEEEQGKRSQLQELREQLASAIREEDYEHAARLRDAIAQLSEEPQIPGGSAPPGDA